MKKHFLTILCLGLLLTGCGEKEASMQDVVNKGLTKSAEHAKLMAQNLHDQKESLPRSIDSEGKLITSDSHWWCSGFFPGTLWNLYEGTQDPKIKEYAEEYTMRVADQQYTTDNHDIGFILYCSFGNGNRLFPNDDYKKIMLQGAQSLSTRYKPNVAAIRSWDHNTEQWQYPVIIDNMMNLELLEWASKNSDSTKFGDIAKHHANTTMKHHFRPDYSCYHVISYDTIAGIPEKKNTHQGLSDESAWARGQAWALYGYTMMYRETKDVAYLDQAKNVANFIMKHPNMPADKIPYWDFDSPDIPNTKRDASAAAIMVSAFIELSTLTDGDFSKECLNTAETQLRTLTTDEYLAEVGTNASFILKHSVGNFPAGREVDVPLTYADYYYTEALVRYKNWILNNTNEQTRI